MVPNLTQRLATPAVAIFTLLNELKVSAILIGGAAGNLNGSNRSTKDLDINVVTPLRFLLHFPTNTFHYDKDQLKDRKLRLTTLTWIDANGRNSIRCDIACIGTDETTVHNFRRSLNYTAVTNGGVRFALPELLLAYKLRGLSQRGVQNLGRHLCDYSDILEMSSRLNAENRCMPQELVDLYGLKDRELFVRLAKRLGREQREDMSMFLETVGLEPLFDGTTEDA